MLNHIKLKISTLTAKVGATNWTIKLSVQSELRSANAAMESPVTVGEMVAVKTRLQDIAERADFDGQSEVAGYAREILHAICAWRVG